MTRIPPHERLYRRLLRLFPREFRGDFSDQMVDDFSDQRDDVRQRGRLGLARLWLHTIGDLVRRAPAEHIDVLRQDGGYALRALTRAPTFAAAVVLTLAVGVGSTAAVFTLADPMLFRPLPYPESDRLVALSGRARGNTAVVHVPDFLLAEAAHHEFEAVMAFGVAPVGGRLKGQTESPVGYQVTRRFFDVLRVRPHLGREFLPEEYQVDAAADAAILTFRFWQAAFGGRADILEQTLALEGPRPRRFRIVGVLPSGFVLPDTVNRPPDFFLGFAPDPALQGNARRLSWPIARLAKEATTGTATVEWQRVLNAVERDFPQFEHGREGFVQPLRERLFGPVTTPLLMLLGTTACVLLLASVNLAHLFMARLHTRRRELGVRLALGASRARLMRLLLMEAAVLAFTGTLTALVIARWTFDLLMARTPEFAHTYRLLPAGLDGRVAAFAVALAGAAAMIFGVLPAIGASRLEVRNGLLSAGPSTRVRAFPRGDAALIFIQCCVAVSLLTTGALLVRSYTRLAYQPLGFDPASVRAVDIDPVDSRGAASDPRTAVQQRRHIYDYLRERLQVPITVAGGWPGLTLPGSVALRGADAGPHATAYPAAGTFFRVLDLRLVAGRLYTDAEAFGDAAVAVIDRRAAARLWPGLDPLGREVVDFTGTARRVIGVVETLKTNLRADDSDGTAFIPFGPTPRSLSFAIRDPGASVSLSQLRSVVAAVAPGALVSLRPLQPFERTLGQPRFLASLLGSLNLLTMALTMIGVFGIVNHDAVRRTRELGIMISLGADRSRIRSLVLRRAFLPAVLGMTLGIGVSLWWTPALQSLLFGLNSNDAATFALACGLVGVVVLIASALPAWRASRVDPIVALRAE